MADTTAHDLPYPELPDDNNPPADFKALAEKIDEVYGLAVADVASLPAVGVFNGQQVYINDIDVMATWDGAVWRRGVLTQSGISSIASGPAAGTPRLTAVVFATPYPTGVVPDIAVTMRTNATTGPHQQFGSVDLITPPTETGFVIRSVNTLNTNAMSAYWIARG